MRGKVMRSSLASAVGVGASYDACVAEEMVEAAYDIRVRWGSPLKLYMTGEERTQPTPTPTPPLLSPSSRSGSGNGRGVDMGMFIRGKLGGSEVIALASKSASLE